MIDSISGRIIERKDNGVVIDVNGFGIYVITTKECINDIPGDKPIKLFTHLAIKRDGFEIYGFKEREERTIFKTLLKVPNVGPKSAINIISSMGAKNIYKSLESADPSPFTQIKGISDKTAKRIVLELKGLLSEVSEKTGDEIIALIKLGYTRAEALERIKKIRNEKGDLPTEELIREVLSRE